MERLRFHYESPTCALDLWAEVSALGQWSAVKAVHPVKFRLRLAATTGGRSRQVIRGNAQQFMALVTALGETQQQWLGRDDLSLLSADLGYCLPEQSGLPPLNLSLLQWCDLNDHLDTLNETVVLLPDFEVKVARWHWSWLNILAMAVTLAGLTWATMRVLMPAPQDSPQFSVATKVEQNPGQNTDKSNQSENATPKDGNSQKVAISPEQPSAKSADQANSPNSPPDTTPKSANGVTVNPSVQRQPLENSGDRLDSAPSVAKDRKSDSMTAPSTAQLPKIALTPSPSFEQSDSKIAPENAPAKPVTKPDASSQVSAPPVAAAAPTGRLANGGSAGSPRQRADSQPVPESINPNPVTTGSSIPDTISDRRFRRGTDNLSYGVTVRDLSGNPELAANLEQYLRYRAGLALGTGSQGKITLEIGLRDDGTKPQVVQITVIKNSVVPESLAASTKDQIVAKIWRWQPNRKPPNLKPLETLNLTVEINLNRGG